MKCPNCYTELPDSATFCYMCKKPIPTGTDNQKQPCPNCGAPLPKTAKECYVCHKKFGNEYNYTPVVPASAAGKQSGFQPGYKPYTRLPQNNTINRKTDTNIEVSFINIIKGVFIAIIAIVLIFGALIKRGEKEAKEKHEQENAESTVTPDKTIATDGFDSDVSGYLFITTDDLSKYWTNLAGQKVYFVSEVGDIDEEKIQVNIDGGYLFTNCMTSISYVDKVKRDDRIVIRGTVEELDEYGYKKLKDCKVVAINNDVDKYDASKSSDDLQEYFYMSDEIAYDNRDEISEEEFKERCQSYDYEDILRNEGQYKKKFAVLSGRVDQVIEGWFGSYSIYIYDNDGNVWGCTYTYNDEESKMLEGDWVTVYGILDGTTTSETVMGKQVTMPYISIEYYDY